MGWAPPEYLEGLVKNGQVLLAVHQQAAGSLPEVLFAPHRYVLSGPHQVQHVAGAEVQT
jgi:hypothetical protein